MNTAIAILTGLVALCVLLGFVIGRLSTAPKGKISFPDLTDAQLAHIAHEATRAYKISTGKITMKGWNNVHPLTRSAIIDRIGNYRRRATFPTSADPIERHIQAAIVALGRP